ncbi:nucleotidyltransferase domain-containing protein [Legionella septentrionalis]|uniref:nucleotidyltransferase domain-containing protein n=1 Tax=Legionella septentrionalis TaxID=2498109 RepID=UPI000F8EA7C5|nr:nucleotidyltransferase [Legionella septentrionalis]RUR14030.1 nucleotidyltransferase [Legionella septentrionalis]
MTFQNMLENFHRKIKVDKEDIRDKRNILTQKIKSHLKENGHPICEIINQGSYIYGVGVIPVEDQEYDIDVGLVFPVRATDYEPNVIRQWIFDSIKNHTSRVEERGPCIRVHYAAGYHVDLVIYAQFHNNINQESYQLARGNNKWVAADPKALKQYISTARQSFSSTKDNFGSDQIQRITRYLKRWNDLDIPQDSPDKPSGLATLLLVIKLLESPFMSGNQSNDFDALKNIAIKVMQLPDRLVVFKPTPEYEDLFKKLNNKAMRHLISRFNTLLEDLMRAESLPENEAVKILSNHFGDDFLEANSNLIKENNKKIMDMKRAIPSYSNPSKPWASTGEK